MSNEQLADLTQPQRDRLAFVELRVRFIGEIRRQDLVTRFGIQSAAASRDLALYKDLASGNIDYDSKGKSYVLGPSFQPVFDFPPKQVQPRLDTSCVNGVSTARLIIACGAGILVMAQGSPRDLRCEKCGIGTGL